MKKSLYLYFMASALFSVPILAQEGLISINKSEEIDRILALKKEINERLPFIKIQIYSGSRSYAGKAIAEFKANFPGQFVQMKYETPNYKVWVGRYRTRLEADRQLIWVKTKFSNAFLLTP
ncbi:MAG: SPOR domain-containing protein [Flavobacteriaceae bacterium]|nr:SPOR domain-containing protein [Flavobacteriaceae bacterium]